MIHGKITNYDTISCTFFFLSISDVLDKIKSSNVKKKTIYGHRWCYEWYKWLDDSDDEAKDNLNEVNGDE